jgi:hypothetical protein
MGEVPSAAKLSANLIKVVSILKVFAKMLICWHNVVAINNIENVGLFAFGEIDKISNFQKGRNRFPTIGLLKFLICLILFDFLVLNVL